MNPPIKNSQFNFDKFLEAQNAVYTQVRRELAAGRKETHWMWFIFPQLAGLGSSPISQRFAIASIHEARLYSDHPLLGYRLRECTEFVLRASVASITDIFYFPDNLKFFSSMTLFSLASPNDRPFQQALDRFFESAMDVNTVEQLARQP